MAVMPGGRLSDRARGGVTFPFVSTAVYAHLRDLLAMIGFIEMQPFIAQVYLFLFCKAQMHVACDLCSSKAIPHPCTGEGPRSASPTG